MSEHKHSTQTMSRISEDFGLEAVCPFLWGDDSLEAQHFAADWMYINYAALAYGEFLKHGRGVLAGPFAKTDDGLLLGCASLKDALFETGKMWTASVSYLPVARKDFAAAIPRPEIRSLLMPALNSYNPDYEVPILLMRNGQPHVFLPSFRREPFSPRYLHETGSNGVGSVEKVVPGAEPTRSFSKPQKVERFKPTFVPLAVG